MNYQNLVFFGDSLAFGARTYGCFPMRAAALLTESSRYAWRVMNISQNGATARSLWFRVNDGDIDLSDVYLAAILIGTNDAAHGSPPELFEEYYRQILRTLAVRKFKAVFCGTIPPLHCDGHAFFTRDAEARRPQLNAIIKKIVAETSIARLVDLESIDASCCVDPAHLNDHGNERVAQRFVEEIHRL